MARQRRRWRDLGRKQPTRAGRGWLYGIAGVLTLAWFAATLGTARRGYREASGTTEEAQEVPADPVAWEDEIAARWEAEWRDRMGPLLKIGREDPAIARLESGDGVVVWFREEGIERQFRNLEGIWRHAEQEGKELATVNLVPERNIPVTFR